MTISLVLLVVDSEAPEATRRQIVIFDVRTGEQVARTQSKVPIERLEPGMAIHPAFKRLVLVGNAPLVEVYEYPTLQLLGAIELGEQRKNKFRVATLGRNASTVLLGGSDSLEEYSLETGTFRTIHRFDTKVSPHHSRSAAAVSWIGSSGFFN
jgi:hypothetical protein